MLDLSRLQHRDLDPLDNDLGLLYPLELGNPPAKLPRIFFFGLFNDAGQTCAQPFQVHRGERWIKLGGMLVIRKGCIPVAVVATEFTPLQVEHRVLRILLDLGGQGCDLFVNGAMGRCGQRSE